MVFDSDLLGIYQASILFFDTLISSIRLQILLNENVVHLRKEFYNPEEFSEIMNFNTDKITKEYELLGFFKP